MKIFLQTKRINYPTLIVSLNTTSIINNKWLKIMNQLYTSISGLLKAFFVFIIVLLAEPAISQVNCVDVQFFKAVNHSDNEATRAAWEAAAGISSPDYLIDFESYGSNGINLEGIVLGPLGLTLTNLEGGAIFSDNDIGSADPIGTRAAKVAATEDGGDDGDDVKITFNPPTPVDYIGFYIIDLNNLSLMSTITVTFTDNSTCSILIDHTLADCSPECSEFFGVVAPSGFKIKSVDIYPNGGSRYGLDNIVYGVKSCSIMVTSATPGACVPATNQYTLTGNLTFANPPTSGTLTVQITGGGSQVFNAPFTSPLSYSIASQTSDGASHTITATFSADLACTKSTTYTAPSSCNCPNPNCFTITKQRN